MARARDFESCTANDTSLVRLQLPQRKGFTIVILFTTFNPSKRATYFNKTNWTCNSVSIEYHPFKMGVVGAGPTRSTKNENQCSYNGFTYYRKGANCMKQGNPTDGL